MIFSFPVADMPQLCQGIKQDRYENDGGSRWNLVLVGEEKPSQATEIPDADGKPDNALEPVREEVGSHLGQGEERDGKHNAHHAQASHNRQGDEHHQGIFEKRNGHPLRTGKFGVEGNCHDGAQKEGEEQGEHTAQCSQQDDVAPGNREDIPEEERRQVGRESRCQEAEDNADGHPEGPEYGYGGIFAHIAPLAEPFHAEGR